VSLMFLVIGDQDLPPSSIWNAAGRVRSAYNSLSHSVSVSVSVSVSLSLSLSASLSLPHPLSIRL
jgi:hypothetical protein